MRRADDLFRKAILCVCLFVCLCLCLFVCLCVCLCFCVFVCVCLCKKYCLLTNTNWSSVEGETSENSRLGKVPTLDI